MPPLISVVIPYYKGERFIRETLDSLFKQKYPRMEIIVVNDGSPQDSVTLLSPFLDRITLLNQKNMGQAVARNAGLKIAQGEIIGMIDQDDLWPGDRLKNMLPYLLSKEYDCVRGLTRVFQLLPDGTEESSAGTLLPVLVGSALYTRETIDRVGLFDAAMREGEDFDWNIRLIKSGVRVKDIPHVTLLYRKHEENYSLQSEHFVQKGILSAIRKKLQREPARKNK